MENFIEKQRTIPVAGIYDVLIAGGGVSGFSAAIAAARTGAKTLIIERLGWLGGFLDSGWGAGTVGYVFNDNNGETILKGICWEILERLKAKGWAMGAGERRFLRNTWPYETDNRVFRPQIMQEPAKAVVMQMVEEAGAQILLHTWISDVIMENGEVQGLVVENKSGRQAIFAKVTVDCTGDGDVAFKAGAPMEILPANQRYQVTRNLTLVNVDTKTIRENIVKNTDHYSYLMEPINVPEGMQHPINGTEFPIERLEVTEDGRHLKGGPGSHSFNGVGILQGVSQIGASLDDVDATDAWEITKAEIVLRKKLIEHWEKLRKERPEYRNCLLVAGSLDLGVRESRRLKGEYFLSERDIAEGRRFKDAIAQSMIALDCHHRGGNWEEVAPKGAYDLPYRIMLPQGVNGLLVSGRCSSIDHLAHAAVRKIPNCMALGQAAGAAAALCAKRCETPRNLDIRELQRLLISQGVPLVVDTSV